MPGAKEAEEDPDRLSLQIVKSPWFDKCCAILICLNALTIGLEVELVAYGLAPSGSTGFRIIQVAFCVLFAAELAMRMAAFRMRFLTDRIDKPWNIFDTIIVSLSTVELVLTMIFQDSTATLSVVRFARIIRVARIIRMTRFLRQLRTLVYTILHTLSSLCWTALVMLIIIYLFAVSITESSLEFSLRQPTHSDLDELIRNFGTLERTAYTLFKSVCGGVSWGEPASSLFLLGPFYVFLMLLYVMFMLFCMANVVTGFFCEHAFEMAQADKDQVIMDQIRQREEHICSFKVLFGHVDEDDCQSITFEQLEELLAREDMQAYLALLDITVESSSNMFKLLDTDGSGELSVEEFVDGLLRLKGQAKTIDLVGLRHDIRRQAVVMADFMVFVEEQFDTILGNAGGPLPSPAEREPVSRRITQGTQGTQKQRKSTWAPIRRTTVSGP
ncbi:unnamed protein product [Effrenium voratum]|uniref:EF-hand domain-containing protein n=1 Tax=Effrenium voratum TaxID=2562239 RepID=A0AA36I5F0_9DINO|nr:unnamed protein product [Effrenium voratum]CAJ1457256.1 unnamed protein product [Effrenium voratum]